VDYKSKSSLNLNISVDLRASYNIVIDSTSCLHFHLSNLDQSTSPSSSRSIFFPRTPRGRGWKEQVDE